MSYKVMLESYFSDRLYEKRTDLCSMMSKWGSDKGLHTEHNYTTLYNFLFTDIRLKELNIFEIGLGSHNINIPSNMVYMADKAIPGGSLRAWKEFFPCANIYGADIDGNILFSEDRIKTVYCDQLNKFIVGLMLESRHIKDIQFDIIIDDGLHNLPQNIDFFNMIIHKLKIGGMYIIEDVSNSFDSQAKAFVAEQSSKYSYIKYVKIPVLNDLGNNNIILVIK